MPDAEDSKTNGPSQPSDYVPVVVRAPLKVYQDALERYEGIRLYEISQALGFADSGAKPRALPGLIAERLGEPRALERVLLGLSPSARLALSLLALTETTIWPLNGLFHSLRSLGVDPSSCVRQLLEPGILVLELSDGATVTDISRLVEDGKASVLRVIAHPAALGAVRTVRPEGGPTAANGPLCQVRETDGLEPILRLGAVWQRVDNSPLRRTQQGTLYKRDRDRLEDDPVLAGPIADAIEPLPDMVGLWLALARGVGLLVDEPESDRIIAAPPEFWSENAIHLPQMIATRWLALRTWHEQGGMQQEGSEVELALPYVRPVVLLWLATVAEDAWVALDDLAAHLRSLNPEWDRVSFEVDPPVKVVARTRNPRPRRDSKGAGEPSESETLESLLLGATYQFGLVRAAEEVPSGRKLVQLTPLGRYILALGPPPAVRPPFDQFLFVQPNFEIIAYRQGLSPHLIGQFSRFAHWSQLGAALELKLTPESVYRGLEGGMTPQEMLDRLSRHSARPLPAGVAEALRTWAGRRDRVTYHASATLIEFASHAELEGALAQWPSTSRVAPIAISDRLLLVEDEMSIPFQRFRLAGARDYRRAPEACLEIEPDGITLTLDLARSDLQVDAELARFADEQPLQPARGSIENPRRRFRVSPSSLARALEHGLTIAVLSHWYVRRTGHEIPPAVRLLLFAAESRVPPLATSRPLVLHTPNAALLDGLIQHPGTRSYFGERLGPTSIVVPDATLPGLSVALAELGLSLAESSPAATPGATDDAATPGPRRSRRV